MPTDTPPPYFPQNTLSPGDEKTARRMRLVFYGCAALAVGGAAGAIAGLILLIRSFL